MAAKPTTGYAPVNGTNIYWESRGAEGTPLIVVHPRLAAAVADFL